jgi:hypothetical protein
VGPRTGLNRYVTWKNLLPLSGIETRSPGRPVRSHKKLGVPRVKKGCGTLLYSSTGAFSGFIVNATLTSTSESVQSKKGNCNTTEVKWNSTLDLLKIF